MSGIDFIFAVAILIMSVVVHEVSHGYAAYFLGDPTAKYAGRLTLNPVRHLDAVGSFIVPVLTYLLGGFILGWAKPVPYNPYNLKNQKWGPAVVGIAGPASNLFLALFFGFLSRLFMGSAWLNLSLSGILGLIVFINLLLAVFNLIPLPPLDGSKILLAVLPYRWDEVREFLERYGFFLLLIFIFFFWRLLLPIVLFLFRILTGASF